MPRRNRAETTPGGRSVADGVVTVISNGREHVVPINDYIADLQRREGERARNPVARSACPVSPTALAFGAIALGFAVKTAVNYLYSSSMSR